MLLKIEDIISTLRFDLNIYNSEAGIEDKGLLDMTDEQILTQVKLGASRLFPDISSLDELEDGSEYPLVLLAKIELVTTLATLKADMVDMNADNNNRLSLGQRWQHYKGLLEILNDQFDKWDKSKNSGEDGGTGGVVTSYNVILDSRHFSRRNYNEQKTPQIKLKVRNVTTDSVEADWSLQFSSHFGLYRVYIGQGEIFDVFKDGGYANDKVTENARLLKTTLNIRDNHIRVKNLSPDTTYTLAVVEVERNQVFCFAEKVFTTLEELPEEEFTSEDVTDEGGGE